MWNLGDHKLRESDIKMLRRHKTVSNRKPGKFHSNEQHDLYTHQILNVITSRKTRWGRHVARMLETRNSYILYVEELEGKRSVRTNWRDETIT
jgi:hypothetical protein